MPYDRHMHEALHNSETLAPPSAGGNQEPWEFKQKVLELFDKVGKNGGYVCSASDHFFETPFNNLVALAEAAKD